MDKKPEDFDLTLNDQNPTDGISAVKIEPGKYLSFSVSVSVSFFLFTCSKGQVVTAYLDTI